MVTVKIPTTIISRRSYKYEENDPSNMK